MLGFSVHRQFIESWQALSDDERDSVKRLLKILQQGHITPGMRSHKVGPFLSLSPNMDLRIIAINQGSKTTLVYVNHHDEAYRWANQRSFLANDVGLAELIDIREFPLSSQADIYNETALPIPIQSMLGMTDDDAFLRTISGMSPEWQEWTLSRRVGEDETTPPPAGSSLVFCPTNDSELIKALALDIPAWQLFMHPVQRDAATNLKHSSIAITGGPGTGKTIVLLNRILLNAPKGMDTDCSILLTYSASLAGYLYDKLKSVSNRHFYILPLYFLGGRVPTNAAEARAYKRLRLDIKEGTLHLKYKDGRQRQIREILVDELQDAPSEALKAIQTLVTSASTRVIIAADADQSIFRKTGSTLIESCQKHYSLNYCYRSTRQIISKAREWRSIFDLSPSSGGIYALSGPGVRFITCDDLSQQISASTEIIRDLLNRYPPESLALIYCQYFNPSFKGPSKEEEAIKSNPDLKPYYHFASTTKGKEYFAGIVFVSDSFLAKDLGPDSNRLRINTLYVALTRFRDEVTVIYPKGCAIENHLQELL